eukprot:CAMPEP_0113469782 /NCGR_PEP_ID=MMETSP0014_2-20120614/16086_1 /TAXON_ID=2857 /ORGANISM="Nitzschia sp." /LENGTH=1176 /DNA_ID=CAMNT_0000362289 /DNA_START=355 /DNA_END=3885 /DNA_ORIENTATION=+ /assembly_acc=CAM_ASM_000159
MTSYIDIDTSPEAILEDEEIIEAVEKVSSKAVEIAIWTVKDDVTTVQNIVDTYFPFIKVWRNDHSVFWSDMKHLGIAAVLFVLFFFLLAPWQSGSGRKKMSSSSSWNRNRSQRQAASSDENEDGRNNGTNDNDDDRENEEAAMAAEKRRPWWDFRRRSRSRSRSRTRHDMRRSWNLFRPASLPYPMERSKSTSNISYYKRSPSSSSPTRQSSSSAARTRSEEYDSAIRDLEEESDEEKFAKRWPFIRQTHYGSLVLPPECKRVEKPKNVSSSRLPGGGSIVSTSSKSPTTAGDGQQTNSDPTNNASSDSTTRKGKAGGSVGADYDNPATRLTNYMEHMYPWRVIRWIFLWIDYPAQLWASIQLAKQVALTLAARRRRSIDASIVGQNSTSDDDDDEDASVASTSTAQSYMSQSVGGVTQRNSSPLHEASTTKQPSMNGEKTPIQTNRTRSSKPRQRRPKKDKERRMENAPPMPPGVHRDDEEHENLIVSNEANAEEDREASQIDLDEPPMLATEQQYSVQVTTSDQDLSEELSMSWKSNDLPEKSYLDQEKYGQQSNDGKLERITSDGTPPFGPLNPSSPKYHTPMRDDFHIDTRFLLSSSATKIPALGTSSKPRDALDSYRKNSVRQLDIRTTPKDVTRDSTNETSDNLIPEIDPKTSSNDSTSGKQFFFEAATSRQSLSRMNVEIPVPDRHGYIVGDEFLPNNSFCPLLVFVNSRSGPQQGHLLITQLRALLNPIQVWDLADGDPKEILESFCVFSRLRILVCGGDGTVSWIVSTIEGMDLQKWPPIAILPLGTGNDLAQIHGWGSGYNNESLIGILDQVADSYISWLDRWEMTIESKKGKVRDVKSFFNYLGVGADAQAALQVHMLRESRPDLFFSRLINKAWYGFFGAEDIFKASSVNLPNDITLIADGVEVPLPEDSQGIILLNIDSYSGGAKLWANGHKVIRDDGALLDGNLAYPVPMKRSKSLDTLKGRRIDSVEDLTALGSLTEKEKYEHVTSCDRPSSCQDGLLDIVSIRGPFHLGQIRVGISTAEKICQCREATIYIRRRHSVQIDGEPWRQDPCILKVRKKKNAAIMLHRSADESNGVESEMAKLLDWAEESRLIDTSVHAAMMREFSRRIESKTRERRDNTVDQPIFSLKRARKSGGNLHGRQQSFAQKQKRKSMGGGVSGISF